MYVFSLLRNYGLCNFFRYRIKLRAYEFVSALRVVESPTLLSPSL
jgi:hypothetical protein